MADAGQQLSDEQARQDAVLDALELGHADHERRLKALEDAQTPTDPTDPTDPGPGPVIPPPAGGLKRFLVNLGFVGRSNGTHPDNPTLPGYADLLGDIAGVIRPMNANRINDYMRVVNGIDEPHYYEQQTWRQALMWQAKLCNDCAADFYFNLPFHASDAFVREAVAFIRSLLDPSLSIWVAWCNEVWNGNAAPYREVKAITGHGMGGGEDLVFFDYWAGRLDDVFGAARAADPSCIRVVETKTSREGTWITGKLHQRLRSNYEAVAVTNYFSPDADDLREGMTADEVFESAREHWRNDELVWQREGIKWATDRGKMAIAYEGGQHFVDYEHRTNLVKTLEACQHDPRMAQMYRDVVAEFDAAGATMASQFEWIGWWDQHGYWGVAPTLAQVPGSLKYKTLVELTGR